MMKNAFHFTLKALFALKIFKSLFELFGYLEKRLDEKDKAKNVKMYIISENNNIKICDVATWETNNCNLHIVQYLTK